MVGDCVGRIRRVGRMNLTFSNVSPIFPSAQGCVSCLDCGLVNLYLLVLSVIIFLWVLCIVVYSLVLSCGYKDEAIEHYIWLSSWWMVFMCATLVALILLKV
jgi:hypothetical protein